MRDEAIQIVKNLQKEGFEAFFVGGCVRDQILGIDPKDFDIATNATPTEVEGLFSRTDSVGKHFGVVIVHAKSFSFEVATYRSDVYSDNSDGRHPDSVEFCSIKEDAKRRDFTINALYFDPISEKLIDFHNGREDLKSGNIKFIGSPENRISEDRLRMLRALRFAGKYDFTIDPKSFEAILEKGEGIKKVSSERIYNELKQILSNREGRILFSFSNLYYHIFGDHSDYNFNYSEKLSFEGFIANMFKHIYGNNLQELLEKLCFEKKSIKKIIKLRSAYGETYCNSVMGEYELNQGVIFRNYDVVEDLFVMSGFRGEIPPLPEQLVFAADLIPLGFEGVELGKKLKELREKQFVNPEITKEELLK